MCGYFRHGCEFVTVLGDTQNKISVDKDHCLLGHLDESGTGRFDKFL